MIDALISNPTMQMLEETLSFSEQRNDLLLEDIANVSVPGFVQKDVSVREFQKSLRRAVADQRTSFNKRFLPESGDTVQFRDDGDEGVRVIAQGAEMRDSVPFHDRGVRNMEYLMSSLADNAMAHNMAAQFLKNRYDLIGRAISMKV